MKRELIDRIRNRSAIVGVIGLGYVGLPLSLRFVEAGFRVLGFDTDPQKIGLLEKAQSYIAHITPDRIAAALDTGFGATDDFSRASEPDALIICVPTPLNAHREPDLSFVIGTTESIVGYLQTRSAALP